MRFIDSDKRFFLGFILVYTVSLGGFLAMMELLATCGHP
jgi:hypothetical protein